MQRFMAGIVASSADLLVVGETQRATSLRIELGRFRLVVAGYADPLFHLIEVLG